MIQIVLDIAYYGICAGILASLVNEFVHAGRHEEMMSDDRTRIRF